jgi:hypothetical protein
MTITPDATAEDELIVTTVDIAINESAGALSDAADEALKIADAQARCAIHLQIARGWKELAELIGAQSTA